MIAYLKGSLVLKTTDHIIVDVQNIGYEVEISTQTFEQLPNKGTALKLLIYHHFTDSDQRLFGFFTRDEKRLFELLITVKGVGPKLGLTILSGLPAVQIIEAIMRANRGVLTQITGIGKKTADRMLLELKDKIENIAVGSAASRSGAAISGNLKEEAASALQSLGIKKKDAQRAVQTASRQSDKEESVEQLVKRSLNRLNR